MNPFLAAAHQEHLDNLAGDGIALEEEIKAVKAEAEDEDENIIYAINQYYLNAPEELQLHDSAYTSGAVDKLMEQRDRAIAYVAKQRLKKRMNEYDPD